MTLVEDCSDKIFTYNIYLTIYTTDIHKGKSKHVHHSLERVCMRCKLCDRWSACALYLAQNRHKICHKVFQLILKKALNSIPYCYGINVLPLVWIT